MGTLVIRVYSFDCDQPKCDEVSEDYIPPGDAARPLSWAKRQARAAGWLFEGQLVLCPNHANPNQSNDGSKGD